MPLVCGAALFDLLNGGDKNWGRFPPYRDLGYAAAAAGRRHLRARHRRRGLRRHDRQSQGRTGLGLRRDVRRPHRRGARRGECLRQRQCRQGPHFWAAPFEIDDEFGGLGFPATLPPAALAPVAKGRPGESTTIAIVATDAALTKAQAKQLAVMAQDGLARALYPAHTTLDGDTVFAVATGRRPLADAVNELTELGQSPPTCWRGPWPGAYSRPKPCLAAHRAGGIVTGSEFQE